MLQSWSFSIGQGFLISDALVEALPSRTVVCGCQGYVQLLVVVTAPERMQIARLEADRGMHEDEVRARMSAQMPLEEKAEVADVVLDNEGSLEELEGQVERLWRDLEPRARASD